MTLQIFLPKCKYYLGSLMIVRSISMLLVLMGPYLMHLVYKTSVMFNSMLQLVGYVSEGSFTVHLLAI